MAIVRMVDPAAIFSHEPLPTFDSFRFVVLKRGTGQDPIKCELITKTIKRDGEIAQRTRWEALSGVWGAYGDLRTITINGKRFQIMRNLFVALSHLRQLKDDR